MKIEIEIKDPLKGCSIPTRRPVYLPFDDTFILLGNCWVRAIEELWFGGGVYICCHKEKKCAG